jgi:hypothetical protein
MFLVETIFVLQRRAQENTLNLLWNKVSFMCLINKKKDKNVKLTLNVWLGHKEC